MVLRTFFFFKHKLHAGQILNFCQYLLKRPKIDRNDSKFFQSEIGTPWTKFLESPLVLGQQFWVSPLLEKSEDLQSIAINQIHLIALLLLLFFFLFSFFSYVIYRHQQLSYLVATWHDESCFNPPTKFLTIMKKQRIFSKFTFKNTYINALDINLCLHNVITYCQESCSLTG